MPEIRVGLIVPQGLLVLTLPSDAQPGWHVRPSSALPDSPPSETFAIEPFLSHIKLCQELCDLFRCVMGW